MSGGCGPLVFPKQTKREVHETDPVAIPPNRVQLTIAVWAVFVVAKVIFMDE